MSGYGQAPETIEPDPAMPCPTCGMEPWTYECHVELRNLRAELKTRTDERDESRQTALSWKQDATALKAETERLRAHPATYPQLQAEVKLAEEVIAASREENATLEAANRELRAALEQAAADHHGTRKPSRIHERYPHWEDCQADTCSRARAAIASQGEATQPEQQDEGTEREAERRVIEALLQGTDYASEVVKRRLNVELSALRALDHPEGERP